MNAVKDKLIALVGEELEAANAIHPPFHRLHEGYAVLLEEVEETEGTLKSVKNYLEMVWHYIRWNEPEEAMQTEKYMEEMAIHLAAEAIQVAAMARKFQAIGKGEDMTANGVNVKAMQKPLTVEELPEYLGEIIWKEEPSMELVPVKMFFVGSIAAEYGEFGVAEDCESIIGDYNYSWRCWAEKPTEEERKAAEWEE